MLFPHAPPPHTPCHRIASPTSYLGPVITSAAKVADATMGADAPSNATLLRTVTEVQAGVTGLAPGAALGLPCGWRTAKSGHTLFLTIEHPAAPPGAGGSEGGPPADVRDVHVSNCGPGLQYHPAEHGGSYPTSRSVAPCVFWCVVLASVCPLSRWCAVRACVCPLSRWCVCRVLCWRAWVISMSGLGVVVFVCGSGGVWWWWWW
jgi:hypothetical protein